MNKGCCDSGKDFQPWPDKGNLGSDKHKNIGLKTLKEKLRNGRGPVHAYIATTVKAARNPANNSDKEFSQKGCGPNFQGDRITVCTCRPDLHRFNSEKNQDPDLKYRGHWYAGFTGAKVDPCENYLFYLVRVEKAFRSQKQIFEYLKETSPEVIRAKNATENAWGDLYQPKPNVSDEWNPSNYERPVLGHCHHRDLEDRRWHEDIEYLGPCRRVALLLGDQEHSYLWSKPLICKRSKFTSPRGGQRYSTLQELLSALRECTG
jgi:hypothetical protein